MEKKQLDKDEQQKLPLALRLITRNTQKGWEFYDAFYINHDWKEHTIQHSIDAGTLGIGATTYQTREELYKNIFNDPRQEIAVTLSTGGFYGRLQYFELLALQKKLIEKGKKIVQVFGGSAGSLSSVVRGKGYTDPKIADHLCAIPKRLTQDFNKVKSNFAYIAGAIMLPFTCKFSLHTPDGALQSIPEKSFTQFLMHHFDELFDSINMYKTGGSLDIYGGFLSEHIIDDIITSLIEKHTSEFEQITQLSYTSDTKIISSKNSFHDLYKETGIDIGVLIAGKEKGSKYETIYLDNRSKISVLDGVMGASNLGNPLQLKIGHKTLYIKDPYFTTKTALKKNIHESIGPHRYHLGIVTLNRFRFNPGDRRGKLGLTNSKERWYADGVIAPDMEQINSLQPIYIQDIDKKGKEIMGDDFPRL